jgi:hypothetical protein
MQVFKSKPGTIFIFSIVHNRERLLTDVLPNAVIFFLSVDGGEI